MEFIHKYALHLRRANQTYDSLRREHASDVAVTKANVKKLQLEVARLKKDLEGKVQFCVLRSARVENVFMYITHPQNQEKEELAQICDDLMKELGNRN